MLKVHVSQACAGYWSGVRHFRSVGHLFLTSTGGEIFRAFPVLFLKQRQCGSDRTGIKTGLESIGFYVLYQ